MNEAQWLGSNDPNPMLEFLRGRGPISERKLRLFAVACCRRIWHLLTDERSRAAVEVAERFADGLATSSELHNAAEAAFRAAKGPFDNTPRGQLGAYSHAAMAAWWTANDSQSCDAQEASNRVFGATVCDPDDPEVEDAAQADLLRDIFGNPFRPLSTIDPAILNWNDGCIVKLATAIYQERDFSQEKRAVLADAMEEAGVEDASLLEHLRGPGPYFCGFWPIDLVLGKE